MRKLSNKDYETIRKDDHFYQIKWKTPYSSGEALINRTLFHLYKKDYDKLFADCDVYSIIEKRYNVIETGVWYLKNYEMEEIK